MPASLALMHQGSETMRSCLTLATLLSLAMMPPALAQSASSTNFQTKPMQSAPASRNGQNSESKIPPAARSGGGGIRVGPGTNEKDDGITVKRMK